MDLIKHIVYVYCDVKVLFFLYQNMMACNVRRGVDRQLEYIEFSFQETLKYNKKRCQDNVRWISKGNKFNW